MSKGAWANLDVKGYKDSAQSEYALQLLTAAALCRAVSSKNNPKNRFSRGINEKKTLTAANKLQTH